MGSFVLIFPEHMCGPQQGIAAWRGSGPKQGFGRHQRLSRHEATHHRPEDVSPGTMSLNSEKLNSE